MISPPPPVLCHLLTDYNNNNNNNECMLYIHLTCTCVGAQNAVQCKKKLTNKHITQRQINQMQVFLNKWDLRLFLKVSNWNVLSYYEFYKNAFFLKINYYIKDLGNNAVCERAEAYQSTARSRIFLVIF